MTAVIMNLVHSGTIKTLAATRLGSLALWERVRVRAIF